MRKSRPTCDTSIELFVKDSSVCWGHKQWPYYPLSSLRTSDYSQTMKHPPFSFAEFLNVFIFHPEDYVFSDSKQEASNLEVSIWLTYVQGVTILINSDTPNADTTKNLLGRIYAVCVCVCV